MQTNMSKQICANKYVQLKTFFVRTCALSNPWLGGQTITFLRIDTVAAEQLEVTRQGGGAGQQTSPPHNTHPPPSLPLTFGK